MARNLTRLQGGYYLVTGLWPLVHFASFEVLSGPKRDRWLVRTVGMLAAVIGLTLMRRPQHGLADLSAGAFVAADLLAVRAGQLPTYLLDAVVEIGFVATRNLRR